MGQTYKGYYIIICLLLVHAGSGAQNTVVEITKDKFDYYEELHLDNTDGWIYHTGNDSEWAKQEIDLSGWRKFKPAQLSVKDADRNGRVEGWFRLKVSIDSSLQDELLYIYKRSKDASEVYLDGKLIASYGRIGPNRKLYKASIDNGLVPIPVTLTTDSIHIIAIHVLDYTAGFSHSLISQWAGNTFFGIAGKAYFDQRLEYWKQDPVYKAIWVSIGGLLCLVFWLMVFLNPSEKSIRLIAICSTLSVGMSLSMTFFDLMGLSFPLWRIFFSSLMIFMYANLTFIPLVVSQIFIDSISKKLRYTSLAIFILAIISVIASSWFTMPIIATVFCLSVSLYIVIKHWKTLKGAQWAFVVGILCMVLCLVLLLGFAISGSFRLIPVSVKTLNTITTGLFLSLPLSMVVYVTIRFKEIISEVQKEAGRVVQLAEEKRELVASQNKMLEIQVQERTYDLKQSLENLQSTQAQLIQSEKMASLGELTAGIAHEIQNPLNFVNNFSELNEELIHELEHELKQGNLTGVKSIIADLIQNEEKIKHHGKRAEAIVKSMLLHSRTSEGQREPTDINALCDEYLRLAYHGFRAKDKSFNADFKTEFDEALPKINVIPQDIGRVILNLVNNAFQALSAKASDFAKASSDKSAAADPIEKQRTNLTDLAEPSEVANLSDFKPLVSISTKLSPAGGGVGGGIKMIQIAISDNGPGIPDDIRDKIFQPFFTTKPAGQGTGLGLSLSYDIVKAHGGQLNVHSEHGEGSEFIITLPIHSQ